MRTQPWIKATVITMMISSGIFVFSSQVSAKQYYKWVDSKGSTHYTATPPPKNAKNTAKVDTYGYSHPITPAATTNSATTPTNQSNPTHAPDSSANPSSHPTDTGLPKGQQLNNHSQPAQ